ncbi:potassium uptake protein, TrkH family [Halobacillus karajensis]|uniref:Ktr system potassium uptake protein B n=1 Tax=Halobacillus karajensis TaxID=195088 RepID=A0A024P9F3_9BACI|nr:TrkH family potassium uptake protein [Halobacillus karajensis]CDQ20287.1 Ktr system potassium uptake protein B [Halobacillus karajensis]CDQ25052.1 Ktr system potassium uptake protein B [Halobacillus karajensis]CDQ28587.1 Ktr system potassium uptake protein B [Halobacillus karajensis]SEI11899.1 potassium uptake protein, TrkH family [Halobacillus karajensis]
MAHSIQKNGSNFFDRLTPFQIIVLFYASAVIISTVLVSLPFLHKEGVQLSFIDALFTAVSAVSVTGLTVVSTADTFNTPGYFVLMFVLQFGGIGVMTLGTFIWLMLGKKIGLKRRELIKTDQNRSTFAGMVKLIKQILLIIILIECIGAIILSIYFTQYFPTVGEAIVQGMFASVSATTNAGFDITGVSLVMFENDYFVQFINILLLTLGAIGFPVLIEIKDYLTHKQTSFHNFSLFAKLTSITFGALVVVGTVLIYILDRNHFFADKSWHEAFFFALFQSVTTRNGGLATMDVAEFSAPTLLVICVLMFIGASPSSVGGGIRTTTFAITLLSVIAYARGKSNVRIFRREIDPDDIFRSFIVINTAITITATAVILLNYFEPQFSFMEILFEACSAFGTTGLSMGITPELHLSGKLIIITLMFIGRIGIFSFLFIIRGKVIKDKYHYPKEPMIIG